MTTPNSTPNSNLTTYYGNRNPWHVGYERSGRRYRLHHVVHHSATGFAWGYGGSGPADLALAILAAHFGETKALVHRARGYDADRALRCKQFYQYFKRDHVGTWPYEGWTITSTEIDAWLESKARMGLW